jgi:hypothetical protein
MSLTLAEYARREGISASTARRRARRGQIRAEKRPAGTREDGTVYREHWVVLEEDPQQGQQDQATEGDTVTFAVEPKRENEQEEPCREETNSRQREEPPPSQSGGGRREEKGSSPWIVAGILALGLVIQRSGRR